MRNPLAGYAVSAAGILVLLVLVTGFVPGGNLQEQPAAGGATRAKGEIIAPRPLLHIPEQFRETMGRPASEPFSALDKKGPLLEMRDGTISLRPLHGFATVRLETASTSLASLLASVDMEPKEAAFVPLSQLFAKLPRVEGPSAAPEAEGTSLRFEDFSLRWNGSEQAVDLSPEVRERTQKVLDELRKLAGLTESLRRQAEQYRPIVEKYAERYSLSPDLVYAIIYTESDFDPDLISNRSAHGLMQVVPETAGGEVHRWLGRNGKPSRSLLLHPETNIKYGTAYMYLLQTRHLTAIDDLQSREYCAIAAYNIGTGGMLRTFGKSHDEAFAAINSLTPDEVLRTLLKKLSSRETKAFLAKVLESRERFSVLG